jgi:hypothetical protein
MLRVVSKVGEDHIKLIDHLTAINQTSWFLFRFARLSIEVPILFYMEIWAIGIF